MFNKACLLACLSGSLPPSAHGARPLSTDDTGTQGKGRLQVETGLEASQDRVAESFERRSAAATAFAFGVRDDLDFQVAFAAARLGVVSQDEEPTAVQGLSDGALEAKWRFAQAGDWSAALKPGVTVPLGDSDRGLGAGHASWRAVAALTRRLGSWGWHANLGFDRNENASGERSGLWRASTAVDAPLGRALRAVAELGVARNPDPAEPQAPVFAQTGVVWTAPGGFDVDFGLRRGLNRAETDWGWTVGATLRL